MTAPRRPARGGRFPWAIAAALSSMALQACFDVRKFDPGDANTVGWADGATDGGPDGAADGAGDTAADGGLEMAADGGTQVDGPCAAETDVQFCVRLGKGCETVTGSDNCGAPRAADCGTCSTGMGCVDNVCQTPVCTTFNYVSTDYAPFSRTDSEDIMVAASASGQSIVYGQSQATCGSFTIVLADEKAPGSGNYAPFDVTAWFIANDMFVGGEMAALSGDGLTLVGISTDQTRLEAAHRSALHLTDFDAPSATDFAAVNSFVAGTAAKFRAPVISADGRELYYTINGISAEVDGIFRSIRASSGVPFPAGQRVTALSSDYEFVTGVSSDRLTLFVFKGFAGWVFTRASTSAEFSNPNEPNPPPQIGDWEHKPFQDCRTLVAMASTSGGCQNEDVFFLYRQQ